MMFTDIVNSTSVGAALGDERFQELIRRHHEILRRQIRLHHGHEEDTAGDSFFATFETPADAIRCACGAAREVQALGVDIRAGVHFTEVESVTGKSGGIGVHLGARTMSAAGPAEVLVTSTTKDLAAGGFEFTDRGVFELKGIDEPQRLFAAKLPGVPPSPLHPDTSRERLQAIQVASPMERRSVRLAIIGGITVALLAGIAWFLSGGGDQPSARPSSSLAPGAAVVHLDRSGHRVLDTFTGVPATGYTNVRRTPIVVGEGAVWLSRGSSVFRVAPNDGTVLDQIPTNLANTLTALGDRVVAIARNSGEVLAFNPADPSQEVGDAASLPVAGNFINNVAAAIGEGDSMWVGFDSGLVCRVNLRSVRYAACASITSDSDSLALGGGRLWVGSSLDETIVPLDPMTLDQVGEAIDLNVEGLAAHGATLWVLETSGNTVRAVTLSSGFVSDPVPVGPAPTGIAASGAGAWVSDGTGSLFHVSDTHQVTSKVLAQMQLAGVAVDPADGGVWVSVGDTPQS